MSFDLPALPDGWAYAPLDSLCHSNSITYGVVQPGASLKAGKPLIRVNNFRDARIDLSDVMYIASEIEARYSRTRLKGGEVLITVVGSVGQVTVVPSSLAGFNVARAVAVINPVSHVAPEWIALCLRSPLSQHLLGSRANTTVQTTINLKDLRALPVPMPLEDERHVITEFVGALDDRITLLRETNATLEAIAQALFKSWFVNFDPVRAKMEGRTPEGMDEATAALFPDSFEETELGLVPRGWAWGKLADLSELNSRSWTARNLPVRVNYVDLAGVKGNVFDPPQSFAFADAPSRARRVLREGDCIVGTVRPGNRSFGFISDSAPQLTGSTGFAVLSPRQKRMAAFVYLCATRQENIERLASLADGGAYPAVRPELVAATTCPVPSSQVMETFDRTARQLLDAIASNTNQVETLAVLRDTLLPRLISGQLRLPDAVAELEAADAV